MDRTDTTFGVIGISLAPLAMSLVAACGAGVPAGESAWRVTADTAGGYGARHDQRAAAGAGDAADSTVYDIFGRDGGFAETVRPPFRVDRFVPPVVRGDTIWAVVTDEVDVQYLVRAGLRPGVDRTGR
jgi:hypothetical protein